MSDRTMRSLLEVHREEIGLRDRDIETLERVKESFEQSLAVSKNECAEVRRQLVQANQRADERRDKIAKLEGVVESLKIELQNERAAHTSTKKRTARKVASS
ncbi:hypothetical protein QNM97_13990 [Gordonia sp. L191]|uniref:hypothetical protein n=1 Tax=Gordonia sp. L191 TaxID=2982699 RepID=UPI0024BF1923|nr:hypothetical protein [Gordonia sp. L191]WHU45163.1 hypothetical protein QNM97_13990 [Gordonia sp. L191]